MPILVHFQEVDHFANEGTWSTGYARDFEAVLKAYPKTTFIGHADAFWANVSADYHNEAAYPSGPISPRRRHRQAARRLRRTSIGDLSANSGNNALSRDPAFTAGFPGPASGQAAVRQRLRLPRRPRRGVSQANNPAATRLAGKCVARETLTVLKSRLAGGVSEDRLGERPQAAEDPGMRSAVNFQPPTPNSQRTPSRFNDPLGIGSWELGIDTDKQRPYSAPTPR